MTYRQCFLLSLLGVLLLAGTIYVLCKTTTHPNTMIPKPGVTAATT